MSPRRGPSSGRWRRLRAPMSAGPFLVVPAQVKLAHLSFASWHSAANGLSRVEPTLQDLHRGHLVDDRALTPAPDATLRQPTCCRRGGHPLVRQQHRHGVRRAANRSAYCLIRMAAGPSLPARLIGQADDDLDPSCSATSRRFPKYPEGPCPLGDLITRYRGDGVARIPSGRTTRPRRGRPCRDVDHGRHGCAFTPVTLCAPRLPHAGVGESPISP